LAFGGVMCAMNRGVVALQKIIRNRITKE
jgi:hypothetical protein